MKDIRFLLCIGLVTLLGSCQEKASTGEAAVEATGNETVARLSARQMRNAGIVTAFPTVSTVSSVLRLNGKVDVPPPNMVSISAPLGGYLKSTNLLPGMRVTKGQVLAVLEDQQYIQLQKDYLAGMARMKYLEVEYERQKGLNLSKSVSDKVYQQTEADYHSEQASVSALAEKLRLAGMDPRAITAERISRSVNICAPINGYVSRVNVNIGRYLSPTEVLFELINPADIHLALKIFEKDLALVHRGQQVTAFTNTRPDRKIPAQVILVGKDLSAERTAEVHCHFLQFQPDLLPGTFMNAELAVESRKMTVLPDDAIVSYEGKEYVFVPGQGGFVMTEVQTGNSENGMTEVLSPGDWQQTRCVVKGAYSLLMFLKNRSEE